MRGHNFINGEWIGGGTARPDINPSNLAGVVGEFSQADVAQAKAAIDGARRALERFSSSSQAKRYAVTGSRCRRCVLASSGGDALVTSPDVDAMSFTGSVPTGKAIARKAIETMKALQMEMGGKNPQVILDDANLQTAVNVSVQSAFFSTGQRCTAASRLVVTQGIHDRFVEAMIERMKTLKVDDALKAGTDIGPVASVIRVFYTTVKTTYMNPG